MWSFLFDRYTVFLFVFVRITGMILFNSFLGRKSVPAILRIGFAFLIAIPVTGLLPSNIEISGMTEFMIVTVKEFIIGFFAGFIIQLFFSSVLIAGDIMDMQLGMSMSKVYDPQSNISMPISGTILNIFFTLIFFVSNSHLTFVKMIVYSFQILPPGPSMIGPAASKYVVLLFGNMLVIALKLGMPVLIVELLSEIGLGILMRAVPQINVFAVGLQLKFLIGLILLVLVVPNLSQCFDNMNNVMFEYIKETLKLLG